MLYGIQISFKPVNTVNNQHNFQKLHHLLFKIMVIHTYICTRAFILSLSLLLSSFSCFAMSLFRLSTYSFSYTHCWVVRQNGRQIDTYIYTQIDRYVDRQTDRHIDRQIDRYTDGQTDRQVYRRIDRYIQTDRQTDRHIDRQIDGYIDGQTESQIDRQVA